MTKGTTKGGGIRPFLVTPLPVPEITPTFLLILELDLLRTIQEKRVSCGVILNRRPKRRMSGGIAGSDQFLRALPHLLELFEKELHIKSAQLLRLSRDGNREQCQKEKNRRLHGLLQEWGEQDLLPIPATDQKDFSLLHSPFEDLEVCSGAWEAHFKRCR